jgi:hypothetical protein
MEFAGFQRSRIGELRSQVIPTPSEQAQVWAIFVC